ncbi:MAG: LemA family protein [Spirochaetes bacterium]|nr:LemA family protein [Spirochaetota bacterium]
MLSKGCLIAAGVAGVLLVILLIIGGAFAGTYNSLVKLDQGVKSSWAQVENVYQRRMDLIPNLVEVVKGYAKHESATLTAVIEARSKATSFKIDESVLNNPASFKKFQAMQGELSSALSRLMVVTEQYPNLKANENFMNLQAQLEGSENRIAVERKRFNEVVQAYNTKRQTFPTILLAGMFGFQEKAYFQAEEGAKKAPKVDFSK